MASKHAVNAYITYLQNDLNGLTDVAQRLLPVRDLRLKHHEKLGGLQGFAGMCKSAGQWVDYDSLYMLNHESLIGHI